MVLVQELAHNLMRRFFGAAGPAETDAIERASAEALAELAALHPTSAGAVALEVLAPVYHAIAGGTGGADVDAVLKPLRPLLPLVATVLEAAFGPRASSLAATWSPVECETRVLKLLEWLFARHADGLLQAEEVLPFLSCCDAFCKAASQAFCQAAIVGPANALACTPRPIGGAEAGVAAESHTVAHAVPDLQPLALYMASWTWTAEGVYQLAQCQSPGVLEACCRALAHRIRHALANNEPIDASWRYQLAQCCATRAGRELVQAGELGIWLDEWYEGAPHLTEASEALYADQDGI